MREILPEAAPGKTLEEVTSPELIQMIVTRHTERVLHESKCGGEFVSDGCSLQEWIYGSVRVRYGINPNSSIGISQVDNSPKLAELSYFEAVMIDLGKLFKRHVKKSFDLFVHLPNELPLAKDGHRPVNEHFRSASDDLLKKTFDELGMRYAIVGGALPERLEKISRVVDRAPVTSTAEAIRLAEETYKTLIM